MHDPPCEVPPIRTIDPVTQAAQHILDIFRARELANFIVAFAQFFFNPSLVGLHIIEPLDRIQLGKPTVFQIGLLKLNRAKRLQMSAIQDRL
tara:strand:+ start:283 stop:558 length:276 start_codon:yes stop_codon:yes gene_type:complete